MLRIIICLLAMMGALSLQAENKELKPRLVVCTDIAPADVEPDDMESMVRLMAYADQFEIEALITSAGCAFFRLISLRISSRSASRDS